MLRFPLPDVVDLYQEVRVLSRLGRDVEDGRHSDEVRRGDGADVLPLAPGDPVNRRVEVGAGVLAGSEVVPIPGRTGVVVARDQLELETRRLTELLGQLEDGGVVRQGSGQVDDFDRAGGEPG